MSDLTTTADRDAERRASSADIAGSSWRMGAAGAAVWGALGVGCLAALLRYPLGRDQQIFALMGDAILAGGLPYVEVWDYKPPGIHLVAAVGRALTTAPVGVRALEALSLATVAPAFGLVSARWVGDARPGLLGAVIALVTVASFGFWHTGQPEVFAGVALAWALVASSGRPRAATWLAVGAVCGVAALFKPTCALPGAVLALWAAELQPTGGRRLGVLAWHAVGLLGTLAAAAGAFAAWGALPELVDAVLGFAVEHARESYVEDGPTEHLHRAVTGFARAAPFAAGCLVPLFALRPVHALEGRARVAAVGAVIASLVGVAVQGRFFLYHHAAAAVLVGLPAGIGLWKALLAVPERLRSAATVAAALGLLSLVPPSAWKGLADGDAELDEGRSHRALAKFSPALLEELGAFVGEHAPPGSLYVWGMEPGLYLTSGRAAASRYVTNEPQRTWWSKAQRRKELLADLQADPPAAILVQHDDVIPFLFGAADDSAEELKDFVALRSWLARSYAIEDTSETFDVYFRRPASPAPASASPTPESPPTSSGAPP